MSKYKPIEGLNIRDDTYLLKLIKEEVKKMPFIREPTRNLIRKLRNVDLHLQTEPLIELWKCLVGDAIIFLKLKDNREKYHDQMTLGTENLFEFLKEFQDFEPILYGAVPNYRDHIAHVFRVFLLGQNVIDSAIGFERVGPCQKNLPVSREEKEAIWCISALTHDLGYSLEVIHHINQSVRSMLQQFGNIPVQELGYSYFSQFGSVSEFAVRFLSSDVVEIKKDQFATHLQAKYYQKFLSALSSFNHGVISSIILMKDLVYFKESDYMVDQFKPLEKEDARQFLIRKEILRAIASHSCDDIYYLGIKNFPFLLKACDEMQEWGRPRLVDVTKRGGSRTELTINRFDGKMLDYKVTFSFPNGYKPSEAERTNTEIEVKEYFSKKCNRWLNVLRSAVGGHQRDLELRFTVEDKTTYEVKTYTLHHKNPSEIEIRPSGLVT